MNCLKNLVVSGLRGRYRSAVRPPARPPTTRCYQSATRRSHEVVQSAGARLFGGNPAFRRPPPPHALVFPRYYSRRRKPPSDVEAFFRVIGAGFVIVYVAVDSIRNGTFERVPYTNRSHFIVVTPEYELELSKSEFADLKKKEGKKILPPSHPDSIRVRGLAKEIIRAAHRGLADSSSAKKQPQTKHLDGINWEVLVVQDNIVNAFCMPGGKIVVYTGLLDKFKTDAEIATVLGHEVGHAIARHIAEKITKNMWIMAMKAVLMLLSDVSTETNNEMASLLFSLPFSRRMEIEADHIGILLLAVAGFDPHVAPGVYEKLGKISGNSSEKKEYLSTHPSSEKRSKLLSEAKVMEKAMTLYRKDSASIETKGFFLFSSEKVSFT